MTIHRAFQFCCDECFAEIETFYDMKKQDAVDQFKNEDHITFKGLHFCGPCCLAKYKQEDCLDEFNSKD